MITAKALYKSMYCVLCVAVVNKGIFESKQEVARYGEKFVNYLSARSLASDPELQR